MPPKRKRPDRPSGDGGRPSPHQPGDTHLGQHDRDDGSGRGRGRGPRGGGYQRSNSAQMHGRGGSQGSPHNVQRSIPPPSQPAPSTLTLASNSTRPPNGASAVRAMSPVRSNFHYETLTNEVVRGWAEKGRQRVLQHGVQSRDDVDLTELSSLFQEFIYAVVEAKLSPADAGSCVKEILGDETSEIIKDSYAFAPHTLFLDSLAMVIDSDPDLFRPSLREFLIATGVSPGLMREVLGEGVLEQLNLVRETFKRVGVRQATNLLYRQANYNLLREETEGYSKLITDLYSISSGSAAPPPEVAEQTFERIKALIGTFDLDVGRVLDVTLDVAASVVVKQVKFFVRLLRASSWWPRSQIKTDGSIYGDGIPNWAVPGYPSWDTTEEDDALNQQRKLQRDIEFWKRARDLHLGAFFELNGRQVTDSMNGQTLNDANGDASRQWVEDTHTLPPPGNRVAAQLLGFKLRFYYSENRGENDVLPANLLYLVAVLCKIGFISLPQIYPHLSPSDENMEQVREDQLKTLEEEDSSANNGPMNALARAGVLPDAEDDGPTTRRPDPTKKPDAPAPTTTQPEEKKKKPLEQKVSLLIQLLTIGAIPEALFILGKFPWIPETFPEALQRIHRLLHVCLSKVYEESKPSASRPMQCPAKDFAHQNTAALPKGSLELAKLPPKKTNPWPYPDAINTKDNSASSWRYFWDEWADNVPVCQTVDDVFALCNTFLNVSGVNIGKDEALLAKLASIGAKSLAEDKSDANRTRWHDLLKRLLVPALSLTKANASVVNAIWNLLRQYPTTTRYTIYAEWYEGQISRLPAMGAAFARARAETRGTMKRISLTNLSEMAKKMAKTSFSSPGVVFKVALDQLESYPNLIEAFVECAKYFPDLSYDVLVWSLLSSLGKSRSRTQAEHALTTSKWLQALSRFSGKVFWRYSVLDPTPVLSYVNDQLFKGNSTDLIILKEFVSSMGGIVDSTDFTDYQVLSMAGGEYLRRHTLIRGQDKRFDNIKSSRRLIHALKESNLAARFLINLSQYRQVAIFQVPEDESHIKLLSSLVDESHQTLLQYLDFLWSNLDPGAFDALVPSMSDLILTYGLDVSLAFAIGRASLVYRMFPWKEKTRDEGKDKAQADKDGDVSMSDTKATNGTPQELAAHEDQKSDDPSQIKAALQPIIATVQETMAPEIWQKISPEFFVTFWTLQLGDLFCPDKIYKQERERLKSEELAIAKDRSDMTRKGQEKKMEKRKELMQLQIGLSEECGEHLLRQAKWKFNLSKQFQTAFPNTGPKSDGLSDMLLEQCFLPRILLSTSDAEYAYRFVKALHDWNAPGFKLMSLYDRLFNSNRLRSLIFTCTVREAEYFGRFLKLVLEDLSRWHKNDSVPAEKDSKAAKDQTRVGAYDREGKGIGDQAHLGFALTLDDNGKPKTFVEHAQFKDLLFRWHKNLNMALKSCLAGSEWMHIRNAITVLRAVLDFFPAVDFMATQFSNQLQKITKQEAASRAVAEGEEGPRVDLSVAAQGALSELQKRKSKWVMVQAFRPNTDGGAQADAEAASSSLRPTAPEFKPTPSQNGTSKTTAEEEDGEVQDGKDSTEKTSQSTAGGSKDSLPAKPMASAKDRPARSSTPLGSSTPARSSTPKAGQDNTPNDTKGSSARPKNLPARPPPSSLPSKPEVAVPSHFNSDRLSRGHDRREPRDSRDSRGPRDSRDARERDARESRDARAQESERGDRARDFSDNPRDPNRIELPPRPNNRASDRANDSSTPSSAARNAPVEPMMNPERAALFSKDGAGPRGPDSERANRAPKADAGGHLNDTPTRGPRDAPRDRGGRPPSPRRGGRQPQEGAGEPSRDERHPRGHQNEPRGPGRDSRDRPLGPGGYRGDRPPEWEGDRPGFDRQRDASGFHGQPNRAQDAGPQQDQNYGRLNPVPAADIPSGPRSRGRGSVRGGHGPPQAAPGRTGRLNGPETPRGASPERQPPTGPASGRGRRGGPEPGPGPATPSSAPSGPESDRRKGGAGQDQATPTGPNNNGPAPGMHPERLKQMGGPAFTPPTGPQQNRHGRDSMGNQPDRPGSTPTSGPPPRQPAASSSTNDDGVPTGPASSHERDGRGGGGRRQLQGINSTLQQAQSNKPEPSRNNNSMRRNQQPRQTLGGSDAQVLTGGSPAQTPSNERSDPMRQNSSQQGPTNADGGDHDRGHRDRDSRGDRSSRSSRRSSRERDRDSNRSSGHDREGKEHRDHRDRRSGAGGEAAGRDEREPRRAGRENSGMEPMGPPPAGGRDGRHRGGGPPPPPQAGERDEKWAGGRSGNRNGPREDGHRSDNRRDSRDDRGRKRKSEEGMGNIPNEREKRQRR